MAAQEQPVSGTFAGWLIVVGLMLLMWRARHSRWALAGLFTLLVIPLGFSGSDKPGPTTRRIVLDLWAYWYGPDPVTGKSRRHPIQERYIFGPIRRDGCAGYQGLLAGRRFGKTVALYRKAVLLLLLNPGDPDDPVWGGIYGRTRREAEKRIVRPMLRELRAIRRDLGIDLAPRWDKANQEIHFANGAAVLIGSYGKNDSLENQRGDTLGWAIVDEIERSFMSADDILSVISVAISDHRARWSCFCWASSPNGLRGMPRMHHEAWQRGDREFFLVTGTIRDNPYLKQRQIETIKSGLSYRMWMQEGLGICLSPQHVVFVEYDEERHVIDYEWSRDDLTVVSCDWGTSNAYICAFKVDDTGRWVVAREQKVVEVSAQRFRDIVATFIAECAYLDGGRLPRLITCDGAVKSERRWLKNAYGQDTTVRWLRKDAEQGISWGLNLVSFMLEPAAANDDSGNETAPMRGTKLFFARDLDPTTDEMLMGMRGAMVMYTYHRVRMESGDLVATNEPSKKNNADHPIDALRYALCCSRRMDELHGGRRLPFIDPELDRLQAQAVSQRYDRHHRRDDDDEDFEEAA